MTLLTAIALAQVHFQAVPAPEDRRFLHIDVHPNGLYALSTEREVWRLVGSDWTFVTRLPPGDEVIRDLQVADDGSVWVLGFRPAATRRFDGAWGPWQATGAVESSFLLDAHGSLWTGTYGRVLRNDGQGWYPAHDTVVEGQVIDCAPHGEAVACATHSGRLMLVEAGRLTPLESPTEAQKSLDVDPGGQLVAHGVDGVWRLDERGWAALGPVRRSWSCSSKACLRVEDDHAWLDLDGDSQRIWTGQTRLSGIVNEHGRVFTLRDGRVHATHPGRGPVLDDVTTDVGLPDLGNSAPVTVVDLDGDGLDDLVVGSDRSLRLLFQRGRTFAEAEPPTDEARPARGPVLACDLDDNGLPDLLTFRDGAVGTYLRNFGTRFEEVGSPGGFEAPPPYDTVHRAEGLCVDLDLDGDRDILFARTRSRQERPRGLVAWENVSHGRLEWLDLAQRGLSVLGWPKAYAAADLDGDGLRDWVVGQMWGDGHQLLRGTTDGGLVDVTAGSSLDTVYAELTGLWLDDVDGDGLLDLLTTDEEVGARGWRNLGELRFEPMDRAWGLDASLGRSMLHSVYVDLDGDGRRDLLGCDSETDCTLLMATGEGFRDASASWPLDAGTLEALHALDLGGDGDQDLLLVGPGPERVLENVSERFGAELTPPRVAPSSFGLARRLAWTTPLDLAALAVGGGIWGACLWTVRRGGSRLLLGGLPGALVVTLLATGWASALELRAGARGLLFALGAFGAIPLGLAEHALHRFRSARRIAGHRLVRKLGEGGMGVVYEAREAGTGERVALKVVHPVLLTRPSDRELFRREVTIATEVTSPRLVQLRSFGECTLLRGGTPAPTAYLVMELLPGATLAAELERRTRLPVAEACAVVRELALALEPLHHRDVVHRDVKPENVMLLPDGAVKLMDLGAARHTDGRTRDATNVLGTLGYLPPEQADPRQAPDPRSDIYACGVVLYELLTGRRPFAEPSLMSLMAAILRDDVPPMEPSLGVPDEVEGIATRALAREPGARFETARELAEALAPWAGDLPCPRPGTPAAAHAFRPDDEAPVWWELLRAYAAFVLAPGSRGLASFAQMLLRRATSVSHMPSGAEAELRRELDSEATRPRERETWLDS